MTTTVRTQAVPRASKSPTRRTARVAGVFYLITFVSIPTLTLYGPVKGADFFISSTSTSGAQLGSVLEVIVALASIGTAVTLFPVLRRQTEGLALAFVASRTLEAAMIFAGVASILSLVALQQPGASGADATSLTVVGQGLVAFYNGAFLVGRTSPAVAMLVIPIVVFELSVGVYLLVKGFKPSPLTAGTPS